MINGATAKDVIVAAQVERKHLEIEAAYRQNVIAVTSSEVRYWQDHTWPGGLGSPISKSALLPRRYCGGAFY